MSYEIKITETREVSRLVGKDYAVVGEKEVARERSYYTGAEDSEPKTRIEKVYGYTPEIEKTVMEKREVLSQCIDVLDLPAVIRAINKL